MTKDESYSKQVLKHYFARVARNELTPWVVALGLMGAGGPLAYQFNGGEPDRVGAENRSTFFSEMRGQEDALLSRVDAYVENEDVYYHDMSELNKRLDALKTVGEDDNRDLTDAEEADKKDVIAKKEATKLDVPEELKQDFQEYMTTLYTENVDGEPTLSEKDVQVLLNSIGNYSYRTFSNLGGENTLDVARSQHNIEHFDSCFADYAPVADDMRSREYAAAEIADCVDSRDHGGKWAFAGGMVAVIFLSVMAGFAADDERRRNSKLRNWAENKPQRPNGH